MSGRRRGTEKKTRVSVSPPPPSPPRRISSRPASSPSSLSSASSSSSSFAAATGRGGGRLAEIPPGIVGIIGGFQDRRSRLASNRASAWLGATLEANCSVKSCLAPQVRDTCFGVCEQRGARMIQEAIANDPSVLHEFSFESLGEYSDLFTGERYDPRRVTFMSVPVEAEEDETKGEEKNDRLSKMTLTFTWNTREIVRALNDHERSRGNEFGALYLPDGKEARDVKERIDQVRAHPLENKRATAYALRDLRDLYERYRKPSTVGEITQRLSTLERELHDDGDDRRRRRAETLRSESIRATYRQVTGRRLVELPPAGVSIPYATVWVTRTIASLFRDASSGGWRLDEDSTNVDDGRVALYVTAPFADTIGTLFPRLLSEPYDLFDRLVLAPAPDDDDASKLTQTAATRLREGVRVWRGADLVAGRFAVNDVEFNRRYPEVARLAARAIRTRAEEAAQVAAERKRQEEAEDAAEEARERETEQKKKEATERVRPRRASRTPSPSRTRPTARRSSRS